jgi:hypothetical protein
VASEPTTGRSSSDAAALRSWFPNTAGLPIVAVVPGAARAAGAVPLTGAPLRVGVVFAGRREHSRSVAHARLGASERHCVARGSRRAGCCLPAASSSPAGVALAWLVSNFPPHPRPMLVARPQSLLAATT